MPKWYEMRLKNVNLRDVEAEVEGKKVKMVSCHNDIDELYHITSFDRLKFIIKSKYLKPGSMDISFSASVSLSANPQHTYGNGNIKIIFYKHEVEKFLKPMLYYDNNEIRSKYGVSAYKHEEDVQKELQKKLGVPIVSIDAVRTKIGMTDRSYIEECEWFTDKDLPVNPSTVKKIVYMIPWRPDISKRDTSCLRSIPHYSSPDIESRFDLQTMVDEIASIGNFIKSNGFDFGVDSCFPYIKYHYSGFIVRLTPENLDRLARGEMPEIERKYGEIEDKDENCKCD